MIKSLPEKELKENYKRFLEELKATKRKSVDGFLTWLITSDFYNAPASSKFHYNFKGGLCKHSLNVLDAGRKLNKDYNLGIPDESIVLACLLHDICKTNFYVEKEVWDKQHKEITNEWQKTKEWGIEEAQPFGHGEKSVILAVRYLDLHDDEIAAIRWHMTAFDAGIHFNYPSGYAYRRSMEKYPLLKLLIISDQIAELIESLEGR